MNPHINYQEQSPKKDRINFFRFPIKKVINSVILIKFQNPYSYLDSFILPSIYWEPIYASILSFFLLLWLINSIMYKFGNYQICELSTICSQKVTF